MSRTGGRCRRGPPWAWGGWCGTGYRSSRTSSLSPPSPARDKGVGGQQLRSKQRTRTSPYCLKTSTHQQAAKCQGTQKERTYWDQCFRIQIGSRFNRFSGSGSGIRIQIHESMDDPKKLKKFKKFHVLKCWMVPMEGWRLCYLGVLYGGLGISKLLFFFKYRTFISAVNFFPIFGNQNLGSGLAPDPDSMNPDPKHWLKSQ